MWGAFCSAAALHASNASLLPVPSELYAWRYLELSAESVDSGAGSSRSSADLDDTAGAQIAFHDSVQHTLQILRQYLAGDAPKQLVDKRYTNVGKQLLEYLM